MTYAPRRYRFYFAKGHQDVTAPTLGAAYTELVSMGYTETQIVWVEVLG